MSLPAIVLARHTRSASRDCHRSLSPSDTVQRVRRKCRFYAAQGIPGIYVFDPEDRTAERWSEADNALLPITAIEIPGQTLLPVSEIWAVLDEEIKQWDFEGS